MKVTKPKSNQILIEDDLIKDIKIKNEKLDKEYDENYQVLLFGYRQKGMPNSIQLFSGNSLKSISVLFLSIMETLDRELGIKPEHLLEIYNNVKEEKCKFGEEQI